MPFTTKDLDDYRRRQVEHDQAIDAEREKAQVWAEARAELGQGRERTLLLIIRALAQALADDHPDTLKKHGAVLVGCARPATVSGIVGYLVDKRYTDLKTTALEEHIGAAIKGP